MSEFKSFYDTHVEQISPEITSESSFGDLNGIIEGKLGNSEVYALAIWKDKVDYIVWSEGELGKVSDLLEIRIFNENGEIHLVRNKIDKPFKGRSIVDTPIKSTGEEFVQNAKNRACGCGVCDEKCSFGKICAYDEVQYLDFSTANKTPKLDGAIDPEKINAIKIRNYISYDDEGMAYIPDFRIVEFCEGGKEVRNVD